MKEKTLFLQRDVTHSAIGLLLYGKSSVCLSVTLRHR